ncbi:histidine triad nucleotide-binding protein 3 [Salmo salar]|uniref:Histidine triad nucleotide-binding protein 3 n=1 Tax=Salmo salar TaxID=8030 RepID=B9ENG5_SALSA|nr:histidine triad nucleotide-binding protein 3 [Salmo salar]ACM09062.1 Histidine triad nucleotide-binding protein 3 [Salmo salar]|eukprot:NP_001139990.1 histidine triad nucleotide-binding protein 3 [Salmo salar]
MENSAGDTVQQRDDNTESNSSSDMEDTCMFCMIAKNQDKDTEIVKQDSELVCFQDINPAAPHHYLVVPKKHIVSCFSLVKEHVKLVERMAEMGRAVLQENGITNPNDIRMGFHRPPYISVPHLHLHVLAPTSEITDCMAHKFTPGTMRFATEDLLRRTLVSGVDPDHYLVLTCISGSGLSE